MAWVILLLAGLFEASWPAAMKLSDGFTKVWPTVATFAISFVGFCLLARAMKTIPLGASYAVFAGIGAAGAVTFGILFFKESVTATRLAFMALIVIGIVGLKFTMSPEIAGH